jgi:hypothetical protein
MTTPSNPKPMPDRSLATYSAADRHWSFGAYGYGLAASERAIARRVIRTVPTVEYSDEGSYSRGRPWNPAV